MHVELIEQARLAEIQSKTRHNFGAGGVQAFGVHGQQANVWHNRLPISGAGKYYKGTFRRQQEHDHENQDYYNSMM